MKKLTALLLSILLTSAAFSFVEVTREDKATEETPVNFMFRFPEGQIYYRGAPGEDETVLKKAMFGLSFHRPRGTNGGWGLERFLEVGLMNDGKQVPVVTSYLLKDARILENEERMFLSFDWVAEDRDIRFKVFMVWYPEQPDWMFVKLKCEGDSTTLKWARFIAYPGNTAGPAERERWFATDQLPEEKLSTTTREVPPDTIGIVFFNRFANENAGCILVMDNDPSQKVKVSGDYVVTTSISFEGDQKEAIFALGGFVDETPEEVIRVFQMEGARNAQNYLKSINWTPKINPQEHEALMKDIEELLGKSSDENERKKYEALKAAYLESAGTDDTTAVLERAQALEKLKTEILERKLKELQ